MISPCYNAVQPGISDFEYQLLCQFLTSMNPETVIKTLRNLAE